MNKAEITLIAQLLTSMKDAVVKLEKAQKNKDLEDMAAAKREILNFQDQINKLI